MDLQGLMVALGWAALAAIVSKAVLLALGWLTRDAEDRLLRQGLDHAVERLDSIPLNQLVQRFLHRFLLRWESSFGSRGYRRFVLISLGLNAAVFLVGAFEEVPASGGRLIPRAVFPVFWIFVLGYTVVGLLPDLFFARVSISALRWASRSLDSLRLPLASLVNCLILVIALMLNVALSSTMFQIVLGQDHSKYARAVDSVGYTGWPRVFYYTRIVPRAVIDKNRNALISRMTHGRLQVIEDPFPAPSAPREQRRASDVASLILAFLGASFQTVLFVGLMVLVLVARITPRPVQRFLSRCCYQLTTDQKPVLSQVGTVLGGAAAVLTMLVQSMNR